MVDPSKRLFDWFSAIVMLLMGIAVAFSPKAIESGGLYLMQNILATPVISIIFILSGGARVVCLITNGRWPKNGPRCRALCSILAAGMWGQMGAALALWSIHSVGFPAIGVWVYAGLTLTELYSCSRAVADGRSA